MTEISELSNCSLNNSEYENDKNYTIRCPLCYSIPELIYDFKSNNFTTKCENKHINKYNSYESFIEDTSIDLNNILCNICKESSCDKEKYRCNDCYLFVCNECKSQHQIELGHANFINLSILDTYSSKNKENKILPENYDINKDYKNTIESINKCENFLNYFKKWINCLTNSIENIFNTLNNYLLTKKKLIEYFKNNNYFFKDNNYNFYAILNLKRFLETYKFINNYIKSIDNSINHLYDKKIDIKSDSIMFFKLISKFYNIKQSSENKEIEDNFFKNDNINEIEDKLNLKNNQQKIEEMKNINIKLNSEVKCFTNFNNDKFIIFGLKSGFIQINEIPNQNILNKIENYNLKLNFKEFDDEIKYLCELNKNTFAASDGKNIIKIIQCNENFSNYVIIQTIKLENENSKIYSMINLPKLSIKEKRNYFCISYDNHILIYKSNKSPIYSKKLQEYLQRFNKNEKNINKNENTNEPLIFTLIKDIELNTLTHCLIEIDRKYIAAACPKSKEIKFFDVTNNFEEVASVKNVLCTSGNNIFTLIPNKDILVVACINGFILISTKKLQKFKYVHCRYSVLSLDMLNNNTIICCCSDRNENKIKQYSLKEDSLLFKKLSEIKIINNDEIWSIKIFNDRIFYLSNSNNIYYLSLERKNEFLIS